MNDLVDSYKMCSIKETDNLTFRKELKKLLYPFVTLSNDFDISASCRHPVTSCEPEIDISNLRIKYMDVSVLYKLVLQCLSYVSTNRNYASSCENKKIVKDISQTVSYLEVENSLMICDDRSSSTHVDFGTLFDIDYNSIEENYNLLLKPKHFQLFKKLMENYLKMEYMSIIGFTFPGVEFKSCEEGISSVIDHVQKLKKDKISKRILFCQQQEYNSSLLFMVFNQLSEYATTLKAVILTHRFDEHPVMYLNYKIISMKTYLLKLRCMELEILCNTYTSKSIPALKTLDKQMTLKRSNLEDKQLYVKHKLSAFENLDPKFKDLLREFSILQKDIKLFQSDFTTK